MGRMIKANPLDIDAANVCTILQRFIKKQTRRFGRDGAVIGLSGGIDSSVTASLAVRALGKDKLLGLIMPERDSDPTSKKDALDLVQYLGIKYKVIPITEHLNILGAYKYFPVNSGSYKTKAKICREIYEYQKKEFKTTPFSKTLLGIENKSTREYVAYYRTKNRIRMTNLYFFAEQNNYIVLGTCTKSEFLVGYFTKYGDSATDIMPLLPIYKTQVVQLARYLNVPSQIIEKAPTSDLIPGITDEYSLDLPYRNLDLILYYLEKGIPPKPIAKNVGITEDIVRYVMKLQVDSTHLRNLPVSPRLGREDSQANN